MENTLAQLKAAMEKAAAWRGTKAQAAKLCRELARLTFFLTLILLPFRYRWVLSERNFPPIYSDYTSLLFFVSDACLLAALGFWAVDLVLNPRRMRLELKFLSLAVFGLAAAGALSVPGSIDPLLSAYHSVRLLILGLFFLYVLNEVRGLKDLIVPISLQIAIQAVVGIGQVLKQGDLGMQVLGEYPLDPAWKGVSIVWTEGMRSLRAYGLSEHPNLLAGCMAFGLALIAGWSLHAKGSKRILAAGIFIVGTVGLLLTFSRAGWLALGAGLACLALGALMKKDGRALSSLVSLALGALIVSTPYLSQNAGLIGIRLNQNITLADSPAEVQSLGARRLLNQAAVELIRDNLIDGVGLGAFPQALRALEPDFPTDYQPVHITWLEATTETGTLGSAIYAILLAAPWAAMWMKRKELSFTPELITASAVLLAVTMVGFFDYYTWLLPAGRLWQWLSWGVWGAAYQRSQNVEN